VSRLLTTYPSPSSICKPFTFFEPTACLANELYVAPPIPAFSISMNRRRPYGPTSLDIYSPVAQYSLSRVNDDVRSDRPFSLLRPFGYLPTGAPVSMARWRLELRPLWLSSTLFAHLNMRWRSPLRIQTCRERLQSPSKACPVVAPLPPSCRLELPQLSFWPSPFSSAEDIHSRNSGRSVRVQAVPRRPSRAATTNRACRLDGSGVFSNSALLNSVSPTVRG